MTLSNFVMMTCSVGVMAIRVLIVVAVVTAEMVIWTLIYVDRHSSPETAAGLCFFSVFIGAALGVHLFVLGSRSRFFTALGKGILIGALITLLWGVGCLS